MKSFPTDLVIGSIPGMILCQLCGNVPIELQMCYQCKSPYCGDCARPSNDGYVVSCVSDECGGETSVIKDTGIALNIIMSLNVRCCQAESGWPVETILRNIEQHISQECEYVIIPWPYGCGQNIRKIDEKTHVCLPKQMQQYALLTNENVQLQQKVEMTQKEIDDFRSKIATVDQTIAQQTEELQALKSQQIQESPPMQNMKASANRSVVSQSASHSNSSHQQPFDPLHEPNSVQLKEIYTLWKQKMGNMCCQCQAQRPSYSKNMPDDHLFQWPDATLVSQLDITRFSDVAPFQFETTQQKFPMPMFADFSVTDVIDEGNGLEKLFKVLKVDLEGVESLMVAYIFNQASFTEIRKSEFERWLSLYQINSQELLVSTFSYEIAQLQRSANEQKKLFSYVFKTGKDSWERNMDINIAAAALSCLLGPKTPYSDNVLIQPFLEYIQKECKALSADEFIGTAEFLWRYTSLTEEYDTADSWPILFDFFYESLAEDDNNSTNK